MASAESGDLILLSPPARMGPLLRRSKAEVSLELGAKCPRRSVLPRTSASHLENESERPLHRLHSVIAFVGEAGSVPGTEHVLTFRVRVSEGIRPWPVSGGVEQR